MAYKLCIDVSYNDNFTYRDKLRQFLNMDISNIDLDSSMDEESYDELLFDSGNMSLCLTDIYSNTKTNTLFKELYTIGASRMFSTDEEIGLCVMLSYDYFYLFHLCLVDFHNGCFDINNTNYIRLKNKIY